MLPEAHGPLQSCRKGANSFVALPGPGSTPSQPEDRLWSVPSHEGGPRVQRIEDRDGRLGDPRPSRPVRMTIPECQRKRSFWSTWDALCWCGLPLCSRLLKPLSTGLAGGASSSEPSTSSGKRRLQSRTDTIRSPHRTSCRPARHRAEVACLDLLESYKFIVIALRVPHETFQRHPWFAQTMTSDARAPLRGEAFGL